jgi:NTP pyrophosphatase (non-canonical NTP hydrolase)
MLTTIEHISHVNLERCLRWHAEGLTSWSESDWFTALAGEVGELGNVIKKMNRVRDGMQQNAVDPAKLRQMAADELADVYLYLDLLAQRLGVSLPEAIQSKFNAVSVREGFPERL